MRGHGKRYDCETDCVEPAASTRILSESDVTLGRSVLRSQVFGGGLPLDTGTLSTVTSPVAGLTGLDTCEKITFSSHTAEPRIWHPTTPNGVLILMVQGHEWTYNDGNYGAVLQQFLTANYTVCGLVMIGGNAVTSGSASNHNSNSQELRQFVFPSIATINTLVGNFSTIHMVGLSGGGWITTLVAALDTRISKSYPIAGSLPLYMPMTGSPGLRDWEQRLPGLSLSYLDLYLLGSCPAGRRQKQILYDEDPCCFSQADYEETNKPYANYIAGIADICGGDYDLMFVTKNVHEWDTAIIASEVLPEL